jgi:mono/diheme cytochrome c family protein
VAGAAILTAVSYTVACVLATALTVATTLWLRARRRGGEAGARRLAGRGKKWFATLAVLLAVLLLARIAFSLYDRNSGGHARTQGRPTVTPTAALPGRSGDLAAGKRIFASAGCSRCHMLAAGRASAALGLSLRPSLALAIARVTNGKSGMPSFRSALTAQEIRDVAAYVVSSEPMGLIRVR